MMVVFASGAVAILELSRYQHPDAPLNPQPSERNIIVEGGGFSAGRSFCGRSAFRLRRHARASAASQKPHSLGYDLGHIPLGPVLIVIRTAANAALDIDLPPLGQILSAGLALFSPDDNVVPLGPLLPVAFGIRPHLGCRDGETRDCPTVGRVAHLGIFAEIANKDNFINRHRILLAAPEKQNEDFLNLIPGEFFIQQKNPVWRTPGTFIAFSLLVD